MPCKKKWARSGASDVDAGDEWLCGRCDVDRVEVLTGEDGTRVPRAKDERTPCLEE